MFIARELVMSRFGAFLTALVAFLFQAGRCSQLLPSTHNESRKNDFCIDHQKCKVADRKKI